MTSECYNYGMGHGCDLGCPALHNGRCPLPDDVIDGLDCATDYEEILAIAELHGVENHPMVKQAMILKAIII